MLIDIYDKWRGPNLTVSTIIWLPTVVCAGLSGLHPPESVRTEAVSLSVVRTELKEPTRTKFFFEGNALHGASALGKRSLSEVSAINHKGRI
jgi:hypothetical protein